MILASICLDKITSESHSFHCSCNEESLQRLGPILSAGSRLVRAKRININLKINGLAYLVEVVGGILIITLALSSTLKIIFPFSLWYGLVVPSCYLINNDDTKSLIMKHGWLTALSRLYTEEQHQNILPTQRQKQNKWQVTSVETKDADIQIPKTHRKTISNEVKQNSQHISKKNVETPNANSCEVVSTPIEVFHISGRITNHRKSNKCQPVTPLFQIQHKNESRKDKICNRTDVITVVDV